MQTSSGRRSILYGVRCLFLLRNNLFLIVRPYHISLKSTEHPLFQVEKLLQRGQETVNDDDLEDYINVPSLVLARFLSLLHCPRLSLLTRLLEPCVHYLKACESYSSAISESNAMSYTSSFGEYNPGGGKDAVSCARLLQN